MSVSRDNAPEAALRESEDRFQVLVDAAPVAILIVDDDGRIMLANAGAEAIFGYARSEVIGRPVEVLVPSAARAAHERHRAGYSTAPRARPMGIGIELEGLRRDGRTFPIEVGLSVAQAQGRTQVIAFITDITARKQAERAILDERSRLARDLHDAVTQSLFSASLIADVLPRLWERDAVEGRRRLEELRALTRGALAEMRILLLELRPGALTEVPLAELLRHVADASTNRTPIGLDLRVDGDGALPPDVQIGLFRIVQEALNNVARHANARGVTIRLDQRAGHVELEVADDGVGFDPASVDASHLGLRIMRERAEAIGAAIVVDGRCGGSAGGSGTRVAVRWSVGDAGGDA
jgi:PAS domain S-box-containing protein